MTREEIKELKGLAASMGLYDDKKPCKRAVILGKAIKALEQAPCEDAMVIHTQGLDEGIRCAMCTNSMKNDRGCDGGCAVNEGMYKEVMNTIRNHIVPPVTPACKEWIPVSKRLPEEEGLYLVYTEEQPFVCSFEDGEFFIDEVLAWMPLPEPYKAESEVQDENSDYYT